MTATFSFKIRTLKHQIQCCLEAVKKGMRSFVDRLIVLEGQLEDLLKKQLKKTMRIQTKTGSESHSTEWRSASVTVNGRPIYEVLKPLVKPEWELIGHKGKHGKWCIAEYEVPTGSAIKFTAKANGSKPIQFDFIAAENLQVDKDGYKYNNFRICGWIVSI